MTGSAINKNIVNWKISKISTISRLARPSSSQPLHQCVSSNNGDDLCNDQVVDGCRRAPTPEDMTVVKAFKPNSRVFAGSGLFAATHNTQALIRPTLRSPQKRYFHQRRPARMPHSAVGAQLVKPVNAPHVLVVFGDTERHG